MDHNLFVSIHGCCGSAKEGCDDGADESASQSMPCLMRSTSPKTEIEIETGDGGGPGPGLVIENGETPDLGRVQKSASPENEVIVRA